MPSHIISEKDTRQQLIDPMLAASGWTRQPFAIGQVLTAYDGCAVAEFPTANGPADYVLCLDGRVVAVVEAKKLTLGPQNVLSQPERYARGLHDRAFDFNGFAAPFLYSTNGEVVWFW